MDFQTVYLVIVFALILLFIISFIFFVRRLLINSSTQGNEAEEIEKKLDRIIEQNDRIISLLKDKK
ncbi:DUF4083 family protein [Virgibacillus kekensis]|uniref:DUF4083 family protein n=1 Tax=Virgibacillus kekensis TaxID=202261 RepID=A0ABV9DN80_9BACI